LLMKIYSQFFQKYRLKPDRNKSLKEIPE